MVNLSAINSYVKGKGLDVSRAPMLSTLQKKENVQHHFVEPDNLYTLKDVVGYESLDYVYAHDLINETKFWRILLKEWFNFCKVKGHIIIAIQDNELLNYEQLLHETLVLLRDKIEFVEQEYDTVGKQGFIVLKKVKSVLRKTDSIDKWTFGIITDGRREDWLEKEIDSIIALKIPHFEIIVCGPCTLKGKKNMKHITFPSTKAWITRKKNLIMEQAKYDNIVMTHNKFIFDEKWYEGMKTYGNYFEVLSCVILDDKDQRAGDWITYGADFDDIINVGNLDYRDWDEHGYIDGACHILKKSVWDRVKWDESLFWNQREDVVLSRDFLSHGIIARFNPHSKCSTFAWRHGVLETFDFDPKILGKKQRKSPTAYYYWYAKQFAKRHVLHKQ